jgi:peptidyl-prolyl cis-trans isomerase D
MLEFMRRFASSLVGKILGGILLIGLAGFGIQNVILTLGGDTVAKVGDQEISTTEFQRAYQQQIQAFAQRTGQSPTNEQALQLGIPSAVIFQLAGNAAVIQLANRYGIGVSDATIAKQVREDPTYFGILGTFDRAIFDQTLQQNGLTEAQFFNLQSKAAQREQVGMALFASAPIPKAAATLLNNFQNGTRTVEYFTLNQTNIPDVGTPTDADLEAYLKAHQDTYKTKETRTVDLIYLNPDVLAPLYPPTEDDIKAEYDKTKGQLTTLEKRHIQQVVLSTPELEKAFTDAKTAGTPFADVVAATKAAPTDFGVLAKADVTDPALADAAFGLSKAGDFAIIPGVAGKRAVAVTEIQAGGQVSYEKAKPDIAKRLASDKAREGYPELQDQIESLRAALKPLKEIADRFKLPIETVTLAADGTALSAVPGLAQEDRAKISDAVFAGTQGKLAPTINFGSTSNAWFDLTKVDAARDQTLADVHDAVATAWTNDKTDAALQAEVKSIMAELDGGKSFADVAAEKNQFSTVSPPITRQGDKTSVLTSQVADKIFATGPSGHGWAVDGDGEYLVYHVTDATPPTGEPADNITSFVANSVRTSITSQFITGVRDDYGVHINQQALAQVLNLDQPAQ